MPAVSTAFDLMMTAETSDVTGPPVAGADRMDLKLRPGTLLAGSLVSLASEAASIGGVNASANDPPALIVSPEPPEDEPLEEPPEEDPDDDPEDDDELPVLVDELEDELEDDVELPDDDPDELPPDEDEPDELPEDPDDDEPPDELEPDDEPPELPSEEGGVAGGAGGGVTDVSVTVGSDDEPAVVGTDPNSKAPTSQMLPRSKLLKSVVVTSGITIPLLIAGLVLDNDTS